jgi:hypothetical protein
LRYIYFQLKFWKKKENFGHLGKKKSSSNNRWSNKLIQKPQRCTPFHKRTGGSMGGYLTLAETKLENHAKTA